MTQSHCFLHRLFRGVASWFLARNYVCRSFPRNVATHKAERRLLSSFIYFYTTMTLLDSLWLCQICHPSKCFVDLIKMKVHLGNTAVLYDLVKSV